MRLMKFTNAVIVTARQGIALVYHVIDLNHIKLLSLIISDHELFHTLITTVQVITTQRGPSQPIGDYCSVSINMITYYI